MAKQKSIKDYEGIYTIDTDGNVYSKNGKIRKTRISRTGYRCIILTKNKKQKHTSIHRILAMAFIKNPKNKSEVNHKDGHKDNNNLDNLEWVTSSENKIHAVKMGLRSYWNSNKNGKLSGENHGMCKISNSSVSFIRKGYTGSWGEISELARDHNVSPTTIHSILNNKSRRNDYEFI